MTCLVAYDISDNRVRARLAGYLKKKGIRIQKSLFALELERHAFKKLLREIRAITGKNEHVAIFRLCRGCVNNAIRTCTDEPDWHIY